MSSESGDDAFLSADEDQSNDDEESVGKPIKSCRKQNVYKENISGTVNPHVEKVETFDEEIKGSRKSETLIDEDISENNAISCDVAKIKSEDNISTINDKDDKENFVMKQNLIKTDSKDEQKEDNSFKEDNIISESTNKDSTLDESLVENITLDKRKDEQTCSSTQQKVDKIPSKSNAEMSLPTLKESKIRAKKPREKLGERLGNKKLGSRITKPLVGISSDSLCKQNEEEHIMKDASSLLEKFKLEDPSPDSNIQTKVDEENQNIKKSNEESNLWGTWGDWGSSLATAASTLSKEVTRGVGTVLETMESGMGVPDVQELAKEMVEKEKNLRLDERNKTTEELTRDSVQQPEESSAYSFGFGTFGSLVSGVSGALENASSKVLLGGLDTLEKIGRKTMDMIQIDDPGLRRKRAFLKASRPCLSTVLRDARDRAIFEEELRNCKAYRKPANDTLSAVCMAVIWDNTEGPAHLEALSLVAKQCHGKTTALMREIPPVYLSSLQIKLSEIKALSSFQEIESFNNIDKKLMKITRDIKLPLQFSKIITGWSSMKKSLHKLVIEVCGLGGNSDYADMQKALFKEIADYVARVVGVFHKAAEVSLITPDFDCLILAKQFQRVCSCISGGLENSADVFCDAISRAFPTSDPVFNETITNIYLQMAEANSYIETALTDFNTVLIYTEVRTQSNDL